MQITRKKIKQILRQYGRLFGYNPHKSLAFLDPKYDLLPDGEEDLLRLFSQAAQEIVDYFRRKDPVKYAGLTKAYLGQLWEKHRRDCEDITAWAITEVQKEWSLDPNHAGNPALFRCVVDQEPVDHSIAWGITESGREIFFDFQTLTFVPKQRILAVT